MGASNVLRRFFLIVLPVVAGLVFLFRRCKATDRGRNQRDRFKVKVFGPLFHKSALSRFSRALATLIRSGVPILMVVVLIIAILIAIAIPTFLGARARAQRTGPRRPACATPWWRPGASTPTPRATPPPMVPG